MNLPRSSSLLLSLTTAVALGVGGCDPTSPEVSSASV